MSLDQRLSSKSSTEYAYALVTSLLITNDLWMNIAISVVTLQDRDRCLLIMTNCTGVIMDFLPSFSRQDAYSDVSKYFGCGWHFEREVSSAAGEWNNRPIVCRVYHMCCVCAIFLVLSFGPWGLLGQALWGDLRAGLPVFQAAFTRPYEAQIICEWSKSAQLCTSYSLDWTGHCPAVKHYCLVL